MGLKITNPGILSTVQDLGRVGYQASGFQVSGAMNKRAMSIANLLVGNCPGEAVIETTYSGISAVFSTPAVVAVTGGDVHPEVNGKPVGMYRAFKLSAGDILTTGFAKNGIRSYFAFSGGLYLKKVMGSLSTNLKIGVGGYLGGALQKDDILFFNITEPVISDIGTRFTDIPKYIEKPATIRVIPGPQFDYFSEAGQNTFFNSTYTLTKDSDRMGIKLSGNKIESLDGVDIVSDGIANGSVQIPSSGMPIIMTADRQTTGGYAKIATVISVDLDTLAALSPGDTVRFQKTSLAAAQRLYKKNLNELKKMEKKWRIY